MITIITVVDETNSHVITMNHEGIKITDATGNSIEMTEDAFNISSQVPFTIDASGQPIEIIGDTIDLNKG